MDGAIHPVTLIEPAAEAVVEGLSRAAQVLDPSGAEARVLTLRLGLRELDWRESVYVRRALARLLPDQSPGAPAGSARRPATVVARMRALVRAAGEEADENDLAAQLILLARAAEGAAGEGYCRATPRCGPCPLQATCATGRQAKRPLEVAASETEPWWHEPREASVEALLAALIGGARADEIAADLLHRAGSFRGIWELGHAQLSDLSPGARRRVVAACEIGRRWGREASPLGVVYTSAKQVYDTLAPSIRGVGKEHLFALLLDGRNRFKRIVEVSRGTLSSSLAHPREVFIDAIRERAGAMILAHNHPSGDPMPSREDDEITERLVQVGRIVGIPVLDHVILGDESYVSYLERKRMPSGLPELSSFVG